MVIGNDVMLCSQEMGSPARIPWFAKQWRAPLNRCIYTAFSYTVFLVTITREQGLSINDVTQFQKIFDPSIVTLFITKALVLLVP